MKYTFFFLATLLFIVPGIGLSQQTPARFNYQAAIRNASGAPIVNQLISLQISITDGSPNGQSQYTERHILSSNDFGLVNLQIGTGQQVSGNFDNITWGTSSKWLKIDIDPNAGTNFIPLGAAELVSVPYALYAQNAGNNASSLDQLNDVNTAGVQTGQVLQWNGSQWVAATAVGAQGPQGPAGPQGPQGAMGLPGPGSGWTDGTAITTSDATKKVGIGLAAPTQKLQLHDADQSATWFQITNGGNGAGPGDGAFIGLINKDIKIENCEAGNITLGTCTNPDQVVLNNNGSLEVNGPLKIAGGSPGAGKVLTSDATGNAAWSTVPGTIAFTGSIYNYAGNAPAIPTTTGTTEFTGPVNSFNFNGNQRLVFCVSAALGRSTSTSANILFSLGLGIKYSGTSQVAWAPSWIDYAPYFSASENNRNSYTIAATIKPSAGLHEFGAAIKCSSAQYLNNNEFMIGYYMIVNE